MANVVDCPTCERPLRVPESLIGQKVKCPACSQIFVASEDVPAPAMPAAVARLEEIHDDEDRTERRGNPNASQPGLFRLGECLAVAQEHWGAVWPSMAGYLLISSMAGQIPVVGFFLAFPLQAGYTIVSLMQIRGKKWEFGDFFRGFDYFGPLLVLGLILVCMVIAAVLAVVAPCVLLIVLAAKSQTAPLIIIAACAVPAGALLIAYLFIRASCFAIPLIVDDDMGPVDAMWESWRLTSQQHLSILAGMIVIGIVGGLGALLCGIGIILTFPLAALAATEAYLQVSGRKRGRKRSKADPEEWR